MPAIAQPRLQHSNGRLERDPIERIAGLEREHPAEVGDLLEGIEPGDLDRVDDDRRTFADPKRNVEIVVLTAQDGVDFCLGESVHPVERLDAQHVATELQRIERGRFGEADPAGEGETIEERSLLGRDRGAQQLFFERMVALKLDGSNGALSICPRT